MVSKKILKISGISALGIAVSLIVYSFLSALIARKTVKVPHRPLKQGVSPKSLGLSYEEVCFPAREDKVKLRGWYIPGQKNSAIIIIQGGYQDRLDENIKSLDLSHDLVKKGYSVLLFDLRGRGESEGMGTALGKIERDIGGAVDYLKTREHPVNHVYILGFSLGAVAACLFAHRYDIGAIILDGCLAHLPTVAVRLADEKGIPKPLASGFLPGIIMMSRLLYGYDLRNPQNIISEVKCPIFFIHEEKDKLIAWEEVQQLYRLSNNPDNQIWQVKGALHSQPYKTSPVEYVARIDEFLSGIEKNGKLSCTLSRQALSEDITQKI
jgi:pimeloyl-ACP methyl ester carboxylesterase